MECCLSKVCLLQCYGQLQGLPGLVVAAAQQIA
jgi:hypothetical protein